jgi:mono/diheme cytochrome c family protein
MSSRSCAVRALVLVAGIAAASVGGIACGNDSTDSLLGGGPAGDSTSASSSGGTTSALDAGGDPALALFQAVLPSFSARCGGSCHVQGDFGAPAFIAPPDAYKAIKGYKGIVVADPSTSLVLTKGPHEGPDLIDPLRSQVQQWLEAEAAKVVNDDQAPTTPAFSIVSGPNTVDLSRAGTGLQGAAMFFDAKLSNGILSLTDMQVVAPQGASLHVAAPSFVVIPAQGAEIPDNSFSNADETVPAGKAETLEPGMLLLTDWSAGAHMRIEFAQLEAVATSTPDGGSVNGGGCKAVGLFQASAAPVIAENNCVSCHGMGGSGNTHLDLSALQKNPPDYAAACAQALTRANPKDPPASEIVKVPTGQLPMVNHPFTQASPDFAPMMEAWIGAE